MSTHTYYQTSDLATTGEVLTATNYNNLITESQAEFEKRWSLVSGFYAVPSLSISGTSVFMTVIDALVLGRRITNAGSIPFTGSNSAGTYYIMVDDTGAYSTGSAPVSGKLTIGTIAWDGTTTLSSLVITAVIGLSIIGMSGSSSVIIPFKGPWTVSTSYSVGDIVTCVVSGITNVYICNTANLASSGNKPAGADWTLFSPGGPQGPMGIPGPAPTPTGTWQSGVVYGLNSLAVALTADSNNCYNTYICILGHTASSTNAPVSGASCNTYWRIYTRGGTKGDAGADGAAQTYTDRGTWANLQSYVNTAANISLVHYNNNLYRCLVSHTSGTGVNAPGTSGGATYWALFMAALPASGVLNFEQSGWVTSTSYSIDDALFHNGGTVYCFSAHTSGSSTEPFVGADWQTVWYPLAIQGTAGTAATSIIPYGMWSDASVSYPLGALVTDVLSAGSDIMGWYICIRSNTSSSLNKPYLDATHWILQWDTTQSYAASAGVAASANSLAPSFVAALRAGTIPNITDDLLLLDQGGVFVSTNAINIVQSVPKTLSFTIDTPTGTDDFPIFRLPYGGVIVRYSGKVLPATGASCAGSLYHDAAGTLHAITSADHTFNGTDSTVSTFNGYSSFAAGTYIVWKSSAISGTPTALIITIIVQEGA